MSVGPLVDALGALVGRIERDDVDPDEVDALMSAVIAAATAGTQADRASLASALAALEQATVRRLGVLDQELRRVGSVREAVSAYGSAVQPFTSGQQVSTRI